MGSGQSKCANDPWNDDITMTFGGLLCAPVSRGGLGADCHFTAWGGIQLGATGWGMKDLYPFMFSANGLDAYTPWDHSQFPVDGVVFNLGTNDNPTAHDPAKWQALYTEFVQNLVYVYYKNRKLAVFLAYGPITTSYEALVLNITSNLVAQGINAHPLDLTLAGPDKGCYGHPSAADNAEQQAKAQPYIAKILGWE